MKLCKRPTCGKEVQPNRTYCSVSCSSQNYVRIPNRVSTACKRSSCRNEMSLRPSDTQKYCSRSCATSDTNKGRPSNSSRDVCAYVYCSDTVNNSQAIYCSAGHTTLGQELDRAFLAVTTGEMPLSQQAAKSLVRFLHGSSCSMDDCGITSWKGVDVPLVLDHIDGNSTNHTLGNLRLVCGNCDMLLPTYKSRNKGNGRHSRRQRYSDGKSY